MAKSYAEFLKQFVDQAKIDMNELSLDIDRGDFENVKATIGEIKNALYVIEEFCEAHEAELGSALHVKNPREASYE